MRERRDNWASTLSALGSVKDKSVGAEFRRRRRLDREQVETLVDQNALCHRAVWKIVRDAFRPGWTIGGGEHEAFRLRVERELRLSERVAEAWGWSRLYGACGLAIPASDGRDATLPLDPTRVRSISAPNPIPAHQIEPELYDAAFGSPSYREILSYRVQTLSPTDPLRSVHASRVLVFEPIKLPIESRIEHLGAGSSPWGPSVLQLFYDELLREGTSRAHANAMMYSASLLVVKLEGLKDEITTQDGARIVRENLAAIREALDALGLLGLGSGDDVQSVQHGFAGAPDLIATQRDALAAALPMPREIGLNESPTGLRGGELSGAQALWFQIVDAERTSHVAAAIERILRLAATAWGYDLGDFTIDWGELWAPDEREQSETAQRNAQTDRTYYEIGAIGAAEVRRKRFVEHERGALQIDEEHDQGARKTTPYMAPALEIVRAVHAGEVPRDAGAQMLIAGGYDPILLGSAGDPKHPIKLIAEAENDDDPPAAPAGPPTLPV